MSSRLLRGATCCMRGGDRDIIGARGARDLRRLAFGRSPLSSRAKLSRPELDQAGVGRLRDRLLGAERQILARVAAPAVRSPAQIPERGVS